MVVRNSFWYKMPLYFNKQDSKAGAWPGIQDGLAKSPAIAGLSIVSILSEVLTSFLLPFLPARPGGEHG
jgi:hypothetical protein